MVAEERADYSDILDRLSVVEFESVTMEERQGLGAATQETPLSGEVFLMVSPD